MPDAVCWRRAVVVFHECVLMSSSWIWESRQAESQRRSGPTSLCFSPARDALKRPMTQSKTILLALPTAVYGTLVQCAVRPFLPCPDPTLWNCDVKDA